ncbi:MAG: hypothetical protein ACYC7A_05435 [Thermoanaerobaculia bacterium]
MTKLVAVAPGAETIRVYFSAVPSTCGEHYIEMRRSDAEQFWASLPLPAGSTTSVRYHFEARDANGAVIASSAPVTVAVSGGCGATALTPDEQQVANHNVVSMTDDEQGNRLCGFKCDTVANVITVDGQMLPYDCNVWSPLRKVGTGVGFLGAGAIIGNLLSDDDEPEQVSPARP